MRSDHHVHRAVGQPAQRFRHLGIALEPAHRPDHDWERRVPFGKSGLVLRRKQRGGHQHGDLLAVLHRLERGAHRDLGLAVADVATDEPVHRHRPFHVVLDLVDRGKLVGRLHVGERVLQLPLPGCVRAERVPGRGHPRRVQPDQLRGDLPHRLAGAPLGLGPVGTAEPVQRGRLTTDVPGDLIKLIGRHVEPVGRLAAPAGRVLDDQVLPDRALDAAAGHLQVPPHAVLLMHDVVAPRELERVDTAAAPARHPPGVPRAGVLSRDVRLGQHGKPHRLPGEPVRKEPGRHARHSRLRRLVEVAEPGAEALPAKHLGQPLRRAMAFGNQRHPPALAQPAAHVGQGTGSITTVRRRRACPEPDRGPVALLPGFRFGVLRQAGRLAGALERRDRPPGQFQVVGGCPKLADRHERGRPQVHRRLPARGRVDPGRFEELPAGADKIGGPRPDPLGIAGKHHTAGWHVVEEQFHLRGEHGRERFHALHDDALGELAEHVGEAGMIGGKLFRTLPDRRCQQQFPARRRPQPFAGWPEAALVGHPEVAGLLDGVAEQLHPDRMLFGRREHVENAAAHRHLAAPLHQVGARVTDFDEPGQHLFEVGGVARLERYRLDLSQAAHHGLQQCPHRGDHSRDRRGPRAGPAGVSEPAQDRQTLAGGVRPGREPLVRQRLPRREVGHAFGRQQRAERGSQILGFPRGGRHREQEPAALARSPGEGGAEQRAQRGRRGHVGALATGAANFGGECGGHTGDLPELGIVRYGFKQTAETHGFPVNAVVYGQHERPART